MVLATALAKRGRKRAKILPKLGLMSLGLGLVFGVFLEGQGILGMLISDDDGCAIGCLGKRDWVGSVSHREMPCKCRSV